MSDDALMQRVRGGDDDAFAEIVDRYKDSLVNYLTHLVRSRDRAEEVAQDASVCIATRRTTNNWSGWGRTSIASPRISSFRRSVASGDGACCSRG